MLRNMLGLGVILNTSGFRRGEQAARDGRPMEDNPFSVGSVFWTDWQLGWRLAMKAAADNDNRRIASLATEASPFDMGRVAAGKGLSPAMNPFHPGHLAYDQWRLGWTSGKAA